MAAAPRQGTNGNRPGRVRPERLRSGAQGSAPCGRAVGVVGLRAPGAIPGRPQLRGQRRCGKGLQGVPKTIGEAAEDSQLRRDPAPPIRDCQPVPRRQTFQALESATDNSAIIRWTTNTGSSLIEHSVVHYGTEPKNLNRRAESPNRWNQSLHYMIHRVSVMNLTPGATYYYTVESVRGDGTPLGGRSNTINQFTTRQHQ